MVKAYIKDRYNKPGNVYLGIPHRLDRPVSGVVVFGATPRRPSDWRSSSSNGKCARSTGPSSNRTPRADSPPESGLWEDWLLKIQDEARTERVAPETPERGGRCCVFGGCRASADGALLEIEPETGRMHQIRVQAATRGWPVRGDFLYGRGCRSGRRRNCRATASLRCTPAA